MEIKILVDRHHAWTLLHDHGLGALGLSTDRDRQIAVTKFADLGLSTERLCTLLNISNKSVLNTSVEECLLKHETIAAQMIVWRASPEELLNVIEHVVSLAECMQAECDTFGSFLEFLKCFRTEITEQDLETRIDLLLSQRAAEQSEPPAEMNLLTLMSKRAINDDFDVLVLDCLNFISFLGGQDELGQELIIENMNQTAFSPRTIASFKKTTSQGLKRNVQKFGQKLEVGIDCYIRTGNRDRIYSAFQTCDEKDFKEELFRLYHETLKTNLSPSNTPNLKELINGIISDGFRRTINEEVLSAALRTKGMEEACHLLRKELETPIISRQIEIARFATNYFIGKPSIQSEYHTSLTTLQWQQRIGTLLNVDPNGFDMSDPSQICLQLLARKHVPNEDIVEFIDVFQVPKHIILFRFLSWQMTGEDSPSSSDNQVATIGSFSSNESILMAKLSLQRSISINWRDIEPRLRWALRSINIVKPIIELKMWLDQTRKTDYERLQFILEEFERLKDDASYNENVHHILLDLDSFQRYEKINTNSTTSRLEFWYDDRNRMMAAIENECRPSNFEKISIIGRASIVKLSTVELKLKTITNLTKMKQSDPDFPSELEKMSDVLTICATAGKDLVSAVDLAIKSYYAVGQNVDNRKLCSAWLQRGLKDIEKYGESIDNEAVLTHYKLLRTLSHKIDISLILTKYGLINSNIQNWIDTIKMIDRKTVGSLFMQLFSMSGLIKRTINKALVDVCALIDHIALPKVYLELMEIWISSSPIPADNVSFIIGSWDRVKCAQIILGAAGRRGGDNVQMQIEIMTIFLQTYNEDAINELLEPLDLKAQGMQNRQCIVNVLRKLEHTTALKSIGIDRKAYGKLTTATDKAAVLLTLIQNVESSARTSKVLSRLAIDFHLVDSQLWSEIFMHYPLGEELFNVARHLNCQPWFHEQFRKEDGLRRIVCKIWNASLFRVIEHDPGQAVLAVYEFAFPILLKLPDVFNAMVKMEYFIPAMQVMVKSKLFDRRPLFDLLLAKRTVLQLLQLVHDDQFILGRSDIIEHLLWSLTPYMLRKVEYEQFEWIRAQAKTHGYIDPVVRHLMDENKQNEMKELLVSMSNSNTTIAPFLNDCRKHWSNGQEDQVRSKIIKKYNYENIPIYLQ